MIRLGNVGEAFLKRYDKLTEIQALSFPIVGKGGNALIIAPTGSGKTEAALVPILDIIEGIGDKSGILALYITPLRALNRDMLKRIKTLASDARISVSVRHGDTPAKEKKEQSIRPQQLIITTPESLQTMLLNHSIREQLKKVRFVIVDELHEIYSSKRGAQLSVGLERLADISMDFQRIGISATVGSKENIAEFLFAGREYSIAETSERKNIDISIEMPKESDARYKGFEDAFALNPESAARIERVVDIVNRSSSSIVFANTRQVVEMLGSRVHYLSSNYENIPDMAVHHSSIDKEERIRVENEFKERKIKGIIATSSLELGIDIGSVDMVVQYNSPRQATRLVQRFGRGGHRAGETSRGIIITGSLIDGLESISIGEAVLSGTLERKYPENLALDVLANQICAIALEYRDIDVEKAAGIIARSSAFRNIDSKAFGSVLDFCILQKLVRVKERRLSIGARTMGYFYQNISMISSRNFFVVKSAHNNRIIANLDESFVANNIEDGSVFITKGLQWKVLSIDENVIYVEPNDTFEAAAIPDWEGEDIPVTKEIAERTYELASKGLHSVKGIRIDKNITYALESFNNEQKKYFAIDPGVLQVEELDNYIIVHSPLGKLANTFFGRVLNLLIAADTGITPHMKVSQYAIIIDIGFGKRPNMDRIMAVFKSTNLKALAENKNVMRNSELFRYKFVQIAKAFGVVEKKANVTKSMANRIIDFYASSPIFEETLRDINKNYFDINSIIDLQERIKKGKTKVNIYYSSGSALANEIFKESYYYAELNSVARKDSVEVKEFEKKLIDKSVELYCTYCGFRSSRKISELAHEAKIACVSCGSTMVSLYKISYEEAVEKKKNKRRLSQGEEKEYREAMKVASLISSYGVRAIMALSTYGIGPGTAAMLLRRLRSDDNAFIADLLNAQKQFVRTKKFWAR